LTIEHAGPIPRELRPLIGTWVFGCDVCQDVCPFNAGGGEPADPALAPRSLEHALPDLVALAARNTNQLRRYVKRTALRRIPRASLLRNVAVALGNTGSPDALPAVRGLLADRDPLVRGHAVWALARLGGNVAGLTDDDPFVAEEITAAAARTSSPPRTPPAP
ncbi:MAG: HEAT repeat domain-containing protein, partial [Deltaproteobacteria bacterium]|nr:HEAT repeat domain-containing protein [Deltaproteobacteria bacterium]